jgi:hypothetical protein
MRPVSSKVSRMAAMASACDFWREAPALAMSCSVLLRKPAAGRTPMSP